MIAPATTEKQTVRCAIYTRKSVTEGLEQEFNSLDAQREAGEAYITSQKGSGWICLPYRYDDGGFSGGNLTRPALEKLLADIKAGLVDCVVVYKVDRLSRSLLDFSRLVEVFDKYGVSFVSVTQPINTADSTGRLMLNILLSFAQYERELIADRTSDKMSAARRRGKWTGGMPVLGYEAVDKKLVVNEDEAPLVREIFALYLKHRSISRVCAILQERGWTTKSWITKKGRVREGKPFTKSTLARHLTNATYIGCVNHRGQIYQGEHRGIIRKQTFDKVQAILKKGQQASGEKVSNKYNFLLKGLLRCKACGTAYVPTTTRKGSKVYRYYACSGAQKNGFKTCPRPTLSAHKMEQMVAQRIRVIGQDPTLQAEVLRQTKRATRAETGRLRAEQKQLAAKRKKVEKETAGLLQALAGGQANGTAISSRLAELEAQTAVLDRRLREIESELQAVQESTVDDANLTQTLSLFEPIWDVLFPAEQARIIHLLVRQIEFDGASGKFAIRFHPTGINALAGEMTQELDK